MSNNSFAKENRKYLELLSSNFTSQEAVADELITLEAILKLPKGTEYFLADIHGEHEAFSHILRNASGVLRMKIDELFSDRLMPEERRELATTIYYPEEKITYMKQRVPDFREWLYIVLQRMVYLSKALAQKYTNHKTEKYFSGKYDRLCKELIFMNTEDDSKEQYQKRMLLKMIELGTAEDFIKELSRIIRFLSVDRMHILGDIYDRGPGPQLIMDELIAYHDVDFQWGNHDLLWLGAAAGSMACLANVLRISARYGNLETLEDGYGINLMPLISFVLKHYADDPCRAFEPKLRNDDSLEVEEKNLLAKIQKAVSVIQFKLEGQIWKENPEYGKQTGVLDKIDPKLWLVEIEGEKYALQDHNFPTIDWNDPSQLSAEEQQLMEKIRDSFKNSEKLKKHMAYLIAKGSVYLKSDQYLLFHGCMPMTAEGKLDKLLIQGEYYAGKDLFEKLDNLIRAAFFDFEKNRFLGTDIFLYLWSGEKSPFFGKDKMATFERYFLKEPCTHKEKKNQYYYWQDKEEICSCLLEDFGIDPKEGRIINGHVPVKVKNGEKPVKAGGKLLVIDGGFSKSYQIETGLAGYTLIDSSYGLSLVSHQPFESKPKAVEEELDIRSSVYMVQKTRRKYIEETDLGHKIKDDIYYLELLLEAYRQGTIKERKKYE